MGPSSFAGLRHRTIGHANLRPSNTEDRASRTIRITWKADMCDYHFESHPRPCGAKGTDHCLPSNPTVRRRSMTYWALQHKSAINYSRRFNPRHEHFEHTKLLRGEVVPKDLLSKT